MRKKSLRAALALAILLALPNMAEAATPIRLWVNDHFVVSDVNPYIENGRTLVPLRFVSNSLGQDVKWNGKDRTVTVSIGDVRMVYTIDSTAVRVTAADRTTTIHSDVPARIKDGRTFVPIRILSELSANPISWDKDRRVVILASDYMKGPITEEVVNSVGEQLAAAINKDGGQYFSATYDAKTMQVFVTPVGERVKKYRELFRTYPKFTKKEQADMIEKDLNFALSLSHNIYGQTGIAYAVTLLNPASPEQVLVTGIGGYPAENLFKDITRLEKTN
ncbi:copper amine oxidase domain protein [Aedoeadaptatus nemausensis]|uniref:Copper amine oxidase domain protein n=1 Tax=Aedoeadaptatus nemausensis TaxID=2582829 RepID=A0A6V6Y197_9FIRM|nr:copper amine oxidase N-terminal domain-containing protein [Peptoniphilus nemausensis]CAC9928610.1 copper amine oxidase domain protein [Peptoniphilus nemausensis]